jgi:uncharacterized protein YcfL
MKIVISVIFSLLLFSACANDPYPNPIVKIIDGCGTNSISISDVKGKKRDDGFLKAQVIGNNNSNDYHLLQYRIVWEDKSGFKIESILSKWQTLSVYANQPFYINGISPNTKAKTFRIYIQQNKEVICNKQSN